jgi:hypothetical protein
MPTIGKFLENAQPFSNGSTSLIFLTTVNHKEYIIKCCFISNSRSNIILNTKSLHTVKKEHFINEVSIQKDIYKRTRLCPEVILSEIITSGNRKIKELIPGLPKNIEIGLFVMPYLNDYETVFQISINKDEWILTTLELIMKTRDINADNSIFNILYKPNGTPPILFIDLAQSIQCPREIQMRIIRAFNQGVSLLLENYSVSKKKSRIIQKPQKMHWVLL